MEVRRGDEVPSLVLTHLPGGLAQRAFTSQDPVHLKTLVRPDGPEISSSSAVVWLRLRLGETPDVGR